MRRVRLISLAIVLAVGCGRQPASPAPSASTGTTSAPRTVEEFRSVVQRVLDETGIPGAGIALVRQDGIEWAGGVGFADRDAKTPVTADTHFRVGSISKTFVAMALVQLSLDGIVNLDSPVSELAPDIRIQNPWESTDPVRVIHLLEHTAGFDDMHFNEMYNTIGDPDLPLADVLKINPRSRIVRWRPGTRMSYSNPGYTVAGYVIEQVTGRKYEEVIQEQIFDPIGMKTSSFRISEADKALLAKGYDRRSGPAAPYSPIYLRPSGNLHSSAAELGAFVHMLLNWGELPDKLVVDPEYLSNMEHPRTTLASRAGLHEGYGSGIAALQAGGFALLGHGGGIEGFTSQYAYSPSRDVGFVVLLNGTYSGAAMGRISTLAIQYLKADVEPPAAADASSQPAFLDRYVGYYQNVSPRNQVTGFINWLFTGQAIHAEDGALYASPTVGMRQRLIPVGEGLFRLEGDIQPTRVFATDDDNRMVMTGASFYLEQVPRWRVEIVRGSVLVSCAAVGSLVIVLPFWLVHARRARPHGFWVLKASLLLCPLAILLAVLGFSMLTDRDRGGMNIWTILIWAGSVVLPIAAVLASVTTLVAWAAGAGRWLRFYALLVSCGAIVLSAYLFSWHMLGFMSWDF